MPASPDRSSPPLDDRAGAGLSFPWGRWLGLLCLACLVLGVAASWWFRPAARPPSPLSPPSDERVPAMPRLVAAIDPRIAYQGPFRNIHPNVAYAGDSACAACHEDLARSFRQHPMGRSAQWVGDFPAIEKFDAAVSQVDAQGYHVSVADHGAFYRQTVERRDAAGNLIGSLALDTTFVVGSGTRARSYLHVHEGAAWQATLTWYSQIGQWDLSPGYEIPLHARRPVAHGCLECHVDRPAAVAGANNRYAPGLVEGHAAIGCERCHGPGQLHVDERSAGQTPSGDFDPAIVNPRHLSHDLRSAICQQCHVAAFASVEMPGRSKAEFRPGLPLEHFVAMYFPQAGLLGESASAQQFSEARDIRCRHDDRPLDCVDCHDPHRKPSPEEAPAYFRAKCDACHERQRCSASEEAQLARQRDCVACHMPKSENQNAVHTSITDHRVLRVPKPRSKPTAFSPASDLIVPVNPDSQVYTTAQRERNFGAAMANSPLASPAYPPIIREKVVGDALSRLLPALKRDPNDEPAWQALAELHGKFDNARPMLEAAQSAAALDPRSERNQSLVFDAAERLAIWDQALAAAEALQQINPTSVSHAIRKATALLGLRRWNEAATECHFALRLNPLDAKTCCLLAIAQHRGGDTAIAPITFKKALELEPRPAARAELSSLFETHAGRQ